MCCMSPCYVCWEAHQGACVFGARRDPCVLALVRSRGPPHGTHLAWANVIDVIAYRPYVMYLLVAWFSYSCAEIQLDRAVYCCQAESVVSNSLSRLCRLNAFGLHSRKTHELLEKSRISSCKTSVDGFSFDHTNTPAQGLCGIDAYHNIWCSNTCLRTRPA